MIFVIVCAHLAEVPLRKFVDPATKTSGRNFVCTLVNSTPIQINFKVSNWKCFYFVDLRFCLIEISTWLPSVNPDITSHVENRKCSCMRRYTKVLVVLVDFFYLCVRFVFFVINTPGTLKSQIDWSGFACRLFSIEPMFIAQTQNKKIMQLQLARETKN